LWLVFPVGASNQNSPAVVSEPEKAANVQSIVSKISLPLDAPEAESQETTKQIAEQKRIDA
jgi:hypothetical protein